MRGQSALTDSQTENGSNRSSSFKQASVSEFPEDGIQKNLSLNSEMDSTVNVQSCIPKETRRRQCWKTTLASPADENATNIVITTAPPMSPPNQLLLSSIRTESGVQQPSPENRLQYPNCMTSTKKLSHDFILVSEDNDASDSDHQDSSGSQGDMVGPNAASYVKIPRYSARMGSSKNVGNSFSNSSPQQLHTSSCSPDSVNKEAADIDSAASPNRQVSCLDAQASTAENPMHLQHLPILSQQGITSSTSSSHSKDKSFAAVKVCSPQAQADVSPYSGRSFSSGYLSNENLDSEEEMDTYTSTVQVQSGHGEGSFFPLITQNSLMSKTVRRQSYIPELSSIPLQQIEQPCINNCFGNPVTVSKASTKTTPSNSLPPVNLCTTGVFFNQMPQNTCSDLLAADLAADLCSNSGFAEKLLDFLMSDKC